MNRGILVIRGGAIGDFVLTLPAIQLLREAFPETPVHILGYQSIIALAHERHYAISTRSIEYAPLSRFFIPGTELPDDLIEYFGSFAQVISYLFDPDGIFAANLERCGVKNLITGSPKITDEAHAVAQLARPMEKLALFLEDPAAALHPSETDLATASSALDAHRPLIAVHPGSGSPKKNLSTHQWVRILTPVLAHRSLPRLVIVGGEADDAQIAALQQALSAPASILKNLPLPVLSAVFSRCDLFLGHDSGISHIAAASRAPCVLAYGTTDPDIWGPLNPQVNIISSQMLGMQTINIRAISDLAIGLLDQNRTQ